MRFVVVAILFAWTSLALAERPRPRPDQIRPKPSAPVTVTLDSKVVADGYEVRLVAIPTRDVPTLELVLAGKTQTFGATLAGQRRELVVRVAVRAGEGLDVVGSASAGGRNKAQLLRVGKERPRAPKRPTTIRTLPDGREIQEVR